MNSEATTLLFKLLQSAICGNALTEAEAKSCTPEALRQTAALAQRHDVLHLVAFALKQNSLLEAVEFKAKLENSIFQAVYRYETQNYEFKQLCEAFEAAKIPFIPLKGIVLKNCYPEPWMRTSCDIDILVHAEDLKNAGAVLVENLRYIEKERATHDVAFTSPQGVSVELHFDLVEENRANNAIQVLTAVWENVSLCEGCGYQYVMTDSFFYFYHIAHMAKHFESGGCGLRPFIDLWILDRLNPANFEARNGLLMQGNLLQFANTVRHLSEIWFETREYTPLLLQMQNFLLHGGVYGTTDNRVLFAQKKQGGRCGYFLSRIFIPYTKLKRYYPVLEKHRWLMPIMQIRRWFMLLKPSVFKMAKHELAANKKTGADRANEMESFLQNIGLE